MKFERTEVWGFEHAMRGMRNPMNSWDKSDTKKCDDMDCDDCPFLSEDICASIPDDIIGNNDIKLAQQLIRAGNEHRKFLRQIFVSVDITAPLYWWKEFDTYKIGITANSTSTMHKLTSQSITMDCFEMDDFEGEEILVYHLADEVTGWSFFSEIWESKVKMLEALRLEYLRTKDKKYWKELIRELPSSWLQKRTITLNYENIYSMIRQRDHHKLCEWSEAFIDWCKSLPYAEELLFLEN